MSPANPPWIWYVRSIRIRMPNDAQSLRKESRPEAAQLGHSGHSVIVVRDCRRQPAHEYSNSRVMWVGPTCALCLLLPLSLSAWTSERYLKTLGGKVALYWYSLLQLFANVFASPWWTPHYCKARKKNPPFRQITPPKQCWSVFAPVWSFRVWPTVRRGEGVVLLRVVVS